MSRFCLCLRAGKIRIVCYACLSKGTEVSAQKGYCDVASTWILAFDDGDAMGMCDGEWNTAAGFCTIISS